MEKGRSTFVGTRTRTSKARATCYVLRSRVRSGRAWRVRGGLRKDGRSQKRMEEVPLRTCRAARSGKRRGRWRGCGREDTRRRRNAWPRRGGKRCEQHASAKEKGRRSGPLHVATHGMEERRTSGYEWRGKSKRRHAPHGRARRSWCDRWESQRVQERKRVARSDGSAAHVGQRTVVDTTLVLRSMGNTPWETRR